MGKSPFFTTIWENMFGTSSKHLRYSALSKIQVVNTEDVKIFSGGRCSPHLSERWYQHPKLLGNQLRQKNVFFWVGQRRGSNFWTGKILWLYMLIRIFLLTDHPVKIKICPGILKIKCLWLQALGWTLLLQCNPGTKDPINLQGPLRIIQDL